MTTDMLLYSFLLKAPIPYIRAGSYCGVPYLCGQPELGCEVAGPKGLLQAVRHCGES
jgi:hypothetical protein